MRTEMVGFEEFWSKFPRKDGKVVASRRWSRLNPPPELVRQILDALEWQTRQDQWRDRRFVPMAKTYISQRRWEDDPPQPTSAVPRHDRGCPHRDPCPSRWICQNATLLGKPLKES